MSARPAGALYTPEILALAVELADYPLTGDAALRGQAVSRVCGSKVAIELSIDAAQAIDAVGARVTACAIGQAATALFLRSARGRGAGDIADALAGIEAWLGGGEAIPAWPGIARLASARPHTARHGAILLPWRAALEALSNPTRPD